MSEIHDAGIVAVQRYDSLNNPAGFGTAIILKDYETRKSVYLLTACHVLQNAEMIDLLLGDGAGGFSSILATPVPVRDSAGLPLFQCYTTASGTNTDLAVFAIFAKDMVQPHPYLLTLGRSSCVFSDSVLVGDRMLAIGFANPDVFDFVRSGKPLATSGVVAFETDISYVLDTKTHNGMSGGIVFKVIPAFGEFRYRAAGIVTSGVSKYPDYSWITKIDFLDSILVDLTGMAWGAEDIDTAGQAP